MHRRFSFRNPPLGSRVVLVAVVLAIPGTLAGGTVSLLLGEFINCSVIGGLAGAIMGAAMEAWNPPAS